MIAQTAAKKHSTPETARMFGRSCGEVQGKSTGTPGWESSEDMRQFVSLSGSKNKATKPTATASDRRTHGMAKYPPINARIRRVPRLRPSPASNMAVPPRLLRRPGKRRSDRRRRDLGGSKMAADRAHHLGGGAREMPPLVMEGRLPCRLGVPPRKRAGSQAQSDQRGKRGQAGQTQK